MVVEDIVVEEATTEEVIITSLWLEKYYSDKPCTEIFIQLENG